MLLFLFFSHFFSWFFFNFFRWFFFNFFRWFFFNLLRWFFFIFFRRFFFFFLGDSSLISLLGSSLDNSFLIISGSSLTDPFFSKVPFFFFLIFGFSSSTFSSDLKIGLLYLISINSSILLSNIFSIFSDSEYKIYIQKQTDILVQILN